MTPTFKIIVTVILIALLAGGGFYFWQHQKIQQPLPNINTASPDTSIDKASEKFSKIIIWVPENYDSYKHAMTEFAQAGGEDPLKTMKFEKKVIALPFTKDVIRASAQAAAEEIAPGGGPAKASIAYLKVHEGTAYVLLDIDLDGWAGVSVSLAIIHPLIEKTLMQFPEIKKVVFGYAPGDKK